MGAYGIYGLSGGRCWLTINGVDYRNGGKKADEHNLGGCSGIAYSQGMKSNLNLSIF